MSIATLFAAAIFAASFKVQTLAEQPRTFPDDAAAPRSIFVVTLSKAASEQGAAWSRRLREATRLAVFQVAVLEDVPRLFRSMVIGSMGKQVPNELRERFWIAVTDSAEWRSYVAAESDADAHVFVLDARSRVVWRSHGAVSDGKLAELSKLPPPAVE